MLSTPLQCKELRAPLATTAPSHAPPFSFGSPGALIDRRTAVEPCRRHPRQRYRKKLPAIFAFASQMKGVRTANKNAAVVPRGGIEPPTRGFSIRCSTI
jgi:hypothetical protein